MTQHTWNYLYHRNTETGLTSAVRFVYAAYYSRERALTKLEDMFANGEVCEGEHPEVTFRGGRWQIEIDG